MKSASSLEFTRQTFGFRLKQATHFTRRNLFSCVTRSLDATTCFVWCHVAARKTSDELPLRSYATLEISGCHSQKQKSPFSGCGHDSQTLSLFATTITVYCPWCRCLFLIGSVLIVSCCDVTESRDCALLPLLLILMSSLFALFVVFNFFSWSQTLHELRQLFIA